ncbi:MAG: hypothetical protein MPJ78_14805 [Hyphomicrobiaceae bacterium]|nr:hypothetical protein [Hyphomicrobiaceae bacterium]
MRTISLITLGSLLLITFASDSSARADIFDETFCRDVKAAAEKINADSSMWVDAVTRQDWMVVLCTGKVVEWNKFVKRPPKPGKDKAHQRVMSDMFCNKNKSFAQAIARGWRVA